MRREDYLKPRPGLTSVEAAALYLSDGATKDPVLASVIDKASSTPLIGEEALKLDRNQRAALQDMMGFPFVFKQRPNKLYVSSTVRPIVRTHCRIKEGEMDEGGNIISEELIDRLVDACLRLKTKWDAEKAKDAN